MKARIKNTWQNWIGELIVLPLLTLHFGCAGFVYFRWVIKVAFKYKFGI
jgi:hypothetical protein